MYNSLILTHLNVSILSWGLHSGRLPKLQKRAVRIITLNIHNAHTEPRLNYLGLLKVNDTFTLQRLKFILNTSRARTFIIFDVPLLLRSMPTYIVDKIYTHCLNGFSNYTKQYMLAGYENSCQTRNCYVCAHA